MKKLLLPFALIILVVGCSKKSDAVLGFAGCQLSKVEATGSATWTDNYTYVNGVKTLWVRTQDSGNLSEAYTYSNGNISKVTTPTGTIDLAYSGGHLVKITTKDLAGSLNYTEDVTYTGNVITYTHKNSSGDLVYTDAYTLNGKDVTSEVYKEYYGAGGSLNYQVEIDYSQYDTYYNPEYLSDGVYYPASLHNYNRVDVTDTDYSTVTPTVTTYNLTYTVTANESNAVATRVRKRSDTGEVLSRTYTYNLCK